MIKFNQYQVSNGTVKARVHYSLDNRCDGRKCVTIYAKDYTGELGVIFNGGEYINRTEMQSDYFDKGHVNLFEDHPLYAVARERVERIAIIQRAKSNDRMARRMAQCAAVEAQRRRLFEENRRRSAELAARVAARQFGIESEE